MNSTWVRLMFGTGSSLVRSAQYPISAQYDMYIYILQFPINTKIKYMIQTLTNGTFLVGFQDN